MKPMNILTIICLMSNLINAQSVLHPQNAQIAATASNIAVNSAQAASALASASRSDAIASVNAANGAQVASSQAATSAQIAAHAASGNNMFTAGSNSYSMQQQQQVAANLAAASMMNGASSLNANGLSNGVYTGANAMVNGAAGINAINAINNANAMNSVTQSSSINTAASMAAAASIMNSANGASSMNAASKLAAAASMVNGVNAASSMMNTVNAASSANAAAKIVGAIMSWPQSAYPWKATDTNTLSNWVQFASQAWSMAGQQTSNWDNWCSKNFVNEWAGDWSGAQAVQFQAPTWVDTSAQSQWSTWNSIVNSKCGKGVYYGGQSQGQSNYGSAQQGSQWWAGNQQQVGAQQWSNQQQMAGQGQWTNQQQMTGQGQWTGQQQMAGQGQWTNQQYNGAESNWNGNGYSGNGNWNGNGYSGNSNWNGNGYSGNSNWNGYSGNGNWNGNGYSGNGNWNGYSGNGNWNGNGYSGNGNWNGYSGNGNWNGNGNSGNGYNGYSGSSWTGNGVAGQVQCAESYQGQMNLTISCPAGSVLTSVTSATWGESAGTCSSGANSGGYCTLDVTNTIQRLCVNSNQCPVSLSTNTLGSPTNNGQSCSAANTGYGNTLVSNTQNTLVATYMCGVAQAGSASTSNFTFSAPNSVVANAPSSMHMIMIAVITTMIAVVV